MTDDLARPPDPIDPDAAAPGDPEGRGHSGRAPVDVLAAIALGGALGSAARYEAGRAIAGAPGSFPWGTFAVNISGSLVLGFVLILLTERFRPMRYARPFLAVGFIGAYTTYSTYAVETDLLARDGHVALAAVYLVGSAAAGLAAVWVGIACGRRLSRRPETPAP